MTRFLGYGRQTIEDSDIQAVIDVLKSDFLTQGPAVTAFEKSIADLTSAKYVVAVANGTAALHIACLAAGLKNGDVGVTQPITFCASANAITYCGARADLVDVDPETMTMSVDGLTAYLADHPECKVVIPVSYGGLSSSNAALRKAAGDRIIIEDASHSVGAIGEDGKMVGTGYADMYTFSFHPVKPITTGEGGAVATDDPDLYKALQMLRSHGIEREPGLLQNTEGAGKPWYHEQQVLGFNYRLCDIQAALGTAQMARLPDFIARRREIAKFYDREFAGMNHIRLVQARPDQRDRSGHHLYTIRIDYGAVGKPREQVMKELAERQVGSQVHYIPVHQMPYHAPRFEGRSFPEAEAYYAETLTLPCFPTLTDDEAARVVAAVRDVLGS